jgi:predicted ribosome quality control (RQC) complex YloA/Tae2 family protein
MSKKLKILNSKKDELLEESKRLHFLLYVRETNLNQVISDLEKCERTLQIIQDVTRSNSKKLKELGLQLEKVQQGGDFAIDATSLFQQGIASLTLLGDLDTHKLKECEIEVLLAKNDEKRATQKLEKVKVECKVVDERCVAFVFEANVTIFFALDKEVVRLS